MILRIEFSLHIFRRTPSKQFISRLYSDDLPYDVVFFLAPVVFRSCASLEMTFRCVVFVQCKIVVKGLLASFLRSKTDTSVMRTTASASVEVRPRQNHRQDGRAGRCFRNGGSPVLFSMQAALYPPGRIMHIVRSHPKVARSGLRYFIWRAAAKQQLILFISPPLAVPVDLHYADLL
jgi:hypothetical protein